MHCSDTAEAENIVGALLILTGSLSFYFRSVKATIIASATALVLYCVAFWLPDKTGYCMSTRMPCNYGMVPGIRFIAGAGIIFMSIALIGTIRSSRAKGTP